MAKSSHIILIGFFLLILSYALTGCKKSSDEHEVLSEADKRKIENALKGLEVHPGLKVTLYASEPLLINPTNLDVDHKGRVWVTEAFNYRPTLNAGNPTRPEGDRIVILEDTDHDGLADVSKVFYQGNEINAALGIAVLGNKVIVSCSPNVWVFTDTDGDDKADEKELLFTGIGGVQHDHAVHAFVFGPDGKLYFNAGNEVKQVLDKNGDPIIDKAGNEVNTSGNPYRQGLIFRCNPDGSEFEVLAHNFRNNYEVAVDSYGMLWQSDNDDDGNKGTRINYIMKYGNYGYVDEMTGASWSSRRTGMHDSIPLRHWHVNDPGSVPNLLQTGAGSPTGIMVYEGRLLPEIFQNQMIHTDAGPNVIRAYPVAEEGEGEGAGYSAEIVNLVKGVADSWFRPVDVAAAPDGSLMVADWYDPGVGGHQMGDQSRGRIYRIAPEDTPYRIEDVDMNRLSDALDAFQSPNMASRYLAWQRLSSSPEEAISVLEDMLSHDNQRMKARAFWLLSKIANNPEKYINMAIVDENPSIRITGLLMALQIDDYDLDAVFTKLVNDPSPQVRREVAIGLRFQTSDQMPVYWATLAGQYVAGDRWYLEALGIGADLRADECFAAWKDTVGDKWNTEEGKDLIWRSRSDLALPFLSYLIEDPDVSLENKWRYFRSLDFHNEGARDKALVKIAKSQVAGDAEFQTLLLNHISAKALKNDRNLRNVLAGKFKSIEDTVQSLDWIRKFDLTNYYGTVESIMLNSRNYGITQQATRILYDKKGLDYFRGLLNGDDASVATTAIQMLVFVNNDETWALKQSIAMDTTKDLALRKQAIKTLGTGWVEEDKLLAMVQNGEVPDELMETAVATMMTAYKGSIRKEALSYMSENNGTNIKPIDELAELTGAAEAGKPIFDRLCQNCHQINGNGIAFGPDLSAIGEKLSKEGLYSAILFPNAGINFGFEGYVITLNDGSKDVGYIASRTEQAIDLRKMGGITTTYQQSDIQSIEALENSLMLDGLVNAMTEQELVDLVTYLDGLK